MTKPSIAKTILVGADLRTIREAARLKLRQVAEHTGHSESHLSRMENGYREITLVDAAMILAACKASDPDRERVLDMVSRAQDLGLLHDTNRTALPPSVATLMCLERGAISIFHLAMLAIPGLMQVEGYTRALLTAANVEPKRIDAIVEQRQVRQSILSKRNAPRYKAILDEGALRMFGNEDVMREQLEHICKLAEQPNIDVLVIPSSQPGYGGFHGPYAKMEFPTIRTIICLEMRQAGLFIDDEVGVAPYLDDSDTLDHIALGSPESVNFLRDRLARFRGR